MADPSEQQYTDLVYWLHTAVHELPLGVLYGMDSASIKQCEGLLDDLAEFERLCADLGLDGQQEFIEGCRWHFERYAQYLSRVRHFNGYEGFVRERGGPLWVDRPPVPELFR